MNGNTIARRVYDFLKDIPPFTFVEEEALLRVSGRIEVQYAPKDHIVFRPGESPKQRFFVVRQGAVELVLPDEEGEEQLVERCGEGEIFGIRPLLAEDTYTLLARAAEDSLLYAVNSEGFKEVLQKYPDVLSYLANSMAVLGRRRSYHYSRYPTDDITPRPKRFLYASNEVGSTDLLELQSIQRAREPVVCSPTTTVREAAEIMTEQEVSSIIIVDESDLPLGIFTDRDIRRNIATGLYSRSLPVGDVMTKPVVCIRPEVTVADIQIAMLRYDIHHVVVTEDGTNQSPVIGVITDHDLLVRQGNNPAVIIQEIRRAKEPSYLQELRERAEFLLGQYLEQEVSISYISTIMTEINDEIIRRCIELSLKEMKQLDQGDPPCAFSYISLGSQGRGEQLLRTDQDSGLIFEDLEDPRAEAIAQTYFSQLAGLVVSRLAQVGFDYCPGNMMASNPRWCRSLSDWKEEFGSWISSPNSESLLNTSIFFDFRNVYGEASFTESLTEFLFERLQQSSLFLNYLARAALQNPAPLTFFRNFMVERSGEHKNQFDLKSRVMMPLTDAARVLVLLAKIGGVNNTFRRYELLAEREPQNAELYRDAAQAYEYLIRLRALFGLRRSDSGRFLEPSELSRLQRILLRNTFTPVKEIQSLLEVRFQLKMLGR
ncbi:MAG: DUF294 nucleotidyltransferase-like domain-containing protein [Bacteroidota bacterium]